MNLVGVLMLLAGPALGGQVAAPQPPGRVPLADGKLQVQLVGNGKICARLHEDEVVKKISPDRTPTRLFSTYGYMFRITALRQGVRPQLFNLLDTGPVRTATREERKPPPRSVNPNPHMEEYERTLPYRDLWMKQNACKSFPRMKVFDLPKGDYVLKMQYQVQDRNGTWFKVIEQESAVVAVRPQGTVAVKLRFLDDGNRREIFFFNPAKAPEAAEDGDSSGEPESPGSGPAGSG